MKPNTSIWIAVATLWKPTPVKVQESNEPAAHQYRVVTRKNAQAQQPNNITVIVSRCPTLRQVVPHQALSVPVTRAGLSKSRSTYRDHQICTLNASCRNASRCQGASHCTACGNGNNKWYECSGSGTCESCSWDSWACHPTQNRPYRACKASGVTKKYETKNCPSGQSCSNGQCS